MRDAHHVKHILMNVMLTWILVDIFILVLF